MMTEPRTEANMSDDELLANATERPWYFDGWDIFTAGSSVGPRGDGHRLVIPLSHLNNTWHQSQQVSRYDAELIVRAVNAYVGEALERHPDLLLPDTRDKGDENEKDLRT